MSCFDSHSASCALSASNREPFSREMRIYRQSQRFSGAEVMPGIVKTEFLFYHQAVA